MAEGFEPLKSDDDVEEILRLAVRSAPWADQGTLRERLNSSATELGISPEALAQAEKEWLARRKTDEEKIAEKEEWRHFKKLQVGEFVSHFGVYAAVNAFLFWIDMRNDGRPGWAFWPLFAWGIAIVIHLFSLFAADHDTEREFQKWRKKRRKSRA